MNEYISVGKKVLKMLLNNGYEAYFIGEAVRNSILKKNVEKVEIITNATNDNIKKIFQEYYQENYENEVIIIEYENYIFTIHTFCANDILDKSAVLNKHYSKSLLDDLSTRDFTINAIAMGYNGKLIDAYDGCIDIKKKRIRHIGNAKVKFSKNPELMIKAIALISELNYSLVGKTRRAINKRKKNLLSCDMSLYMNDFMKIFNGQYSKKAILMLNKTNLDVVLPQFKKTIRILGSHYKKVNFEESLLMTFVLNEDVDRRYDDYVGDIVQFLNIYNLACANKLGDYDPITLYVNGLDVCLKANYVNYLLGRCRNKTKRIKKLWRNLKVKSIDDLRYREQDLQKIILPKDYDFIKDILNEVCIAILANEINNTYSDIQGVVVDLLQKNNIRYNLNGYNYITDEEENNNKVQESINVDNDIQTKKETNENEKIKQMIEKDGQFKDQLVKFLSDYMKEEEGENEEN